MATQAGKSAAAQTVKYFMGKCMPSVKTNATRVQIPVFEYDDYLHMHFRKYQYIFAHDPNRLCKTGDMVLVQSLPEKMTKHITHKVIEVIMPLGDVTDPVTGKKVAASVYRENIKKVNEFYGESKTAFKYDKNYKRGSLEDKRDFTHKPAYKKYYEDPNEPQPYAV
ncbi:hypothetical protein TSAR_004698 [Trichomalopsis sarcophagae]|uniref:28S ribosomal protein S17, mitochondrial n=1 Tax=Trichomalopsis sarcophagae TaxID=543379 RepID=A0A232EPC3_9HYME|nr:hypothetical protein TSAR_004698 [Trichomalopsis sarcophagae]